MTGPIPATEKALQQANLTIADMDLSDIDLMRILT